MANRRNKKYKLETEQKYLLKILQEKLKNYDECVYQENMLLLELNELQSKMNYFSVIYTFNVDYEDIVSRLNSNGELLKNFSKAINENEKCIEQMLENFKKETDESLVEIKDFKKIYKSLANDEEFKRLEQWKIELTKMMSTFEPEKYLVNIDKKQNQCEEKEKIAANLNSVLELAENNLSEKLEKKKSKQDQLKLIQTNSADSKSS